MPVQTHVTELFIGTNVKHLYDAICRSFLELTNKLNNGRAWVFGADEVGETWGQPVFVGILRSVPGALRKLCTASKEAGQGPSLICTFQPSVESTIVIGCKVCEMNPCMAPAHLVGHHLPFPQRFQ